MAAGGGGSGGSASAVKAGKAYISCFLDDKEFTKGLTALKVTYLRFANNLKRAGSFGAIVGGSALTGLGILGKQALDAGGKLADLADRLGAPVEELNALGYAAELAGSGLDDVETSVGKLQQAIAEGKNVGGLNLGGLLGKSLPDQIDAVADALAGVEDPAQRTALAMELFGKSGRKMIPFLSLGAPGMAAFRIEAAKVTGVTEAQVNAFDRVGDSISKIWTATKSIGGSIAEAVFGNPKNAESMAASFVNMAAGVREFVKTNAPLIKTMALVTAGITAASVAAIGAGVAMTTVATAATMIGTAFTAILTKTGIISIGVAAIAGAAIYLAREFTDIGSHFSKTWNGIVQAVQGGQLQLAFKIAFAGIKVAFAELIKEMSSGWMATATIMAATAKGFAMGGPVGAGIAAAGTTAALLAANTAAEEGLESSKAELASLLAQSEAASKKALAVVKEAATVARHMGGPTKGGFGTMSQLQQQLQVNDQVNKTIADNTKMIANNTAATTKAIEKMKPLAWAA